MIEEFTLLRTCSTFALLIVAQLRRHHQTYWSVTQSQIAPYIDTIIGFFVLDDADVQPDWDAAKAHVEAIASAIHANYPNAHILINLAGAFSESQRGRYSLGMALFWPSS